MIKVTGLTKTFKKQVRDPGIKGMAKGMFIRKYDYINAVDNVSFDIDDGEIVGYIGANGAGKSTTIKMMTGILTPTSGKVIIDGIEPYIKRIANAKNIGVVFGQKTQLWWDLPVGDTFDILKEIYEVSDKNYKKKMEFFNEVLEIHEFSKTPVRQLSLGQRMRADIAASLLHSPKTIFLDEPTIGLDVLVKERIREFIKEMNMNENITVILTTHDMQDIEDLCHRIIVIDHGKIIYDGQIKEIRHMYGDLRTVTVEVKDANQVNDFNLDNVLKDKVELIREENKLILKFDNDIVPFGSIAKTIFSSLDVIDINNKAISIEDIAKKIYKEAGE